MKYFTLALIMVAPCLAQASQNLTGILSTSSTGRHSIQEVATDLPNCGTVEDAQANSAECLQGGTFEVVVPEPGLGDDDQADARDALEAELQRLSGNLVRLTGELHTYAHGRAVFFVLSLHDPIQTIAAPQAPEPCPNYNGVCKPPQPQPEPQPLPCGNYNGVCH